MRYLLSGSREQQGINWQRNTGTDVASIAYLTPVIVLCLSLNLVHLLDSVVLAQDSERSQNLCGFNRVKKFDTGGNLIASWGEKGEDNGEFIHPHGIAVDHAGNIYVTDEERQDV